MCSAFTSGKVGKSVGRFADLTAEETFFQLFYAHGNHRRTSVGTERSLTALPQLPEQDLQLVFAQNIVSFDGRFAGGTRHIFQSHRQTAAEVFQEFSEHVHKNSFHIAATAE